MNVQQCRVCLSERLDDNKSIFLQFNSVTIAEKIKFVTGIEV